MSGYGVFSSVYDLLNTSAQYDERAEYVLKLFRKYSSEPTLLLDFACGTGEFSRRFADEGIEVIGVDPSPDMLGVAASKTSDILYLCQDAYSLELYGTVDGAICMLDSINHITDKDEILELFSKVALYLEPEKLFIFDVNTVFKHKEVLADNCFSLDEDGVFLSWQNYLRDDGVTVDIDLTFFVEGEGGKYIRYDESFSERAYTDEEIKEMLKVSGFEVVAAFSDLTENEPCDTDERIYYIAKRK